MTDINTAVNDRAIHQLTSLIFDGKALDRSGTVIQGVVLVSVLVYRLEGMTHLTDAELAIATENAFNYIRKNYPVELTIMLAREVQLYLGKRVRIFEIPVVSDLTKLLFK